tara:strand:+ start:460 stop:618 length:159 start_codon:yes stop_codon:yes gene_type:complete
MKYNDDLMIEFGRLCSNKSEQEIEDQLIIFKRFWLMFTKDKTKKQIDNFLNN